MTMVSYAQNFEDVMLWRALKDIENGFYIDIGANDPVIDSVSLVFYERGWRGVHIEPMQQYSDKLRQSRPDERVEQTAIGKQPGSVVFFEFEDTGLSTADIEIAEQHKQKGFAVTETRVDVQPLSVILNQYSDRSIHWIKIDVEGLEKEVIESWGDASARPWILVIESTKPLTTEESFRDWEDVVLEKGYIFAYFDGLNRFYVHESHQELLKYFAVPPNVFDETVLSGLASNSLCANVLENVKQAEARASEAEIRVGQFEIRVKEEEARLGNAETKLKNAEAKIKEAEARVKEAEGKACEAEIKANMAETKASEAEAHVQALMGSTSWRIAAPVRYAGEFVKCLKTDNLKNQAKRFLRHIAAYTGSRPRLKRAALFILNRFPKLKSRLVRITADAVGIAAIPTQKIPTELAEITPRARQIFHDLKDVIGQKNKENR